jgi:hypothetical protein
MNLRLRLAILSSPIRTQVRLGAQIGISEARLSRIVNGWVVPTDDERSRIAVALNEHQADLFADVQSAPASPVERVMSASAAAVSGPAIVCT